MKNKNDLIPAILVIFGLIIFISSGLILIVISLYTWFTNWDINMKSFGYIVYMMENNLWYRYSFIGLIVGYISYQIGLHCDT